MSALAKILGKGAGDAAEVARFAGYFCGLTLVDTEDELAYLAAADGTVFVEHQDEWTLTRDAARTGARGGPAKPSVDPKPLKKRAEWLIEVFLEISRDSERALAAAAPYAAWEKERSTAASKPYLASYWILSHWLLGNAEAFEQARALCAKSKDPIAKELAAALAKGIDAKPALGRKLAARLVAERARVRSTAPAKLLAPAVKKARAAVDKKLDGVSADETAAYEALRKDKNRRTAEAVKVFEELKAAAGEEYLTLRRDLWPLVLRFEELVDARWLPVLKAAYDRQAPRPDVHKKVIPGVVLGLAAACADLDAFFAAAPPSSTAAFKSDRQLEYAAGVAHFAPDPRAMKWLTSRAEDQIRRVNEWDVPENAAYRALVRTKTPEARAALKRVLAAKIVDGRNWHLLCRAAVAAGRIGAKEAIPGVKRMLAEMPADDRWRPQVKRALDALEG